MKLHDPAIERELLRLAIIGRGGKPMEARDPPVRWLNRMGAWLPTLFLLYIFSGALGAYDPRLRTEHWQTLILCMLLLLAAQIGQGTLVGGIFRQNYHVVFGNLPITGKHAFRWVRSRFLRENWFPVLTLGFACAFARHDFSLADPWMLAVTTFLLCGTTFASMVILTKPLIGQFRIKQIWNVAFLMLTGWLILLFFTNRRIFRDGETPEALVHAILSFTWILPPSWAMPGRLQSGGLFLALGWIGWGIARWITWPKSAAPYFDAPKDFSAAFEDFDDWDEDNDFPTDEPGEEADPADQPAERRKAGTPVRLPSPLAMPCHGWVERWIHHRIGEKDAHLLGALCDPELNWTKKTRRALIALPTWLCIVWAFAAFFPESDWKETIILWIWIASVVLPIVALLPATNALPRATASWIVGLQGFPIFSALPIGARDLLRISMRMTTFRSFVMAVIATPYAWCLLAVLDPESDPRASFWLIPAFCCFWATSRPLFIWYRLQEKSYPRRGIWIANALVSICNLVLCLAWVVSGVVGIVSGVGLFWGGPSGDDVWFLPLLAGIGLLASALCARAVFEIYQWRLARGHLDWLSNV